MFLAAALVLPAGKAKNFFFKTILFVAGATAAGMFAVFIFFILANFAPAWQKFFSALNLFLNWQVGAVDLLPVQTQALFKILVFAVDIPLLLAVIFLLPVSWIYAALSAFIFLAWGVEALFADFLPKKAVLFGAGVLSGAIRLAARGMGPLPLEEYQNVFAPPASGARKSAIFWMISLFLCAVPFFFFSRPLGAILVAVVLISSSGLAILLLTVVVGGGCFKKRKERTWWPAIPIFLSSFFILFLILSVGQLFFFDLAVPVLLWLAGTAFFIFSLKTMWRGKFNF